MRKRGRRDRWTRPLFAITDPATSEATSTSVVDTKAGALVTITGPANPQSLSDPTNPDPGRWFTFLNNDTSTDSVNVDGYTIEPGEGMNFVWDGTEWLPVGDGGGGGGSGGAPDRLYGMEFNELPNGSRTTFTLSQDYIHSSVNGEVVYYSGQRLKEGADKDYVATESGGVGTGYDSIVMSVAPKSWSELSIDYTPDT